MSTILLTVAITPNVASPVAVRDPNVRTSQYLTALRSWMAFTQDSGHTLAIVETTGTSTATMIRSLPAGAQRHIDALNVDIPDDVRARGKGAAEFYAVEQFLLMRRSTTSLYKVTGRLRVANARSVFGELDTDEIRVRGLPDRSFVDTRVLGAGADAWRFVLPHVCVASDDATGVYAEHALAGAIALGTTQRRIVASRFTSPPQIVGNSGSTGARYSHRNAVVRRGILRPAEDILAWLAAHKQV